MSIPAELRIPAVLQDELLYEVPLIAGRDGRPAWAQLLAAVPVDVEDLLAVAVELLTARAESGDPTGVLVRITDDRLESLAEIVDRVLADAAIEPGRLALLLAEDAVIEQLEPTAELVERLALYGVVSALADAGFGYAAVTELRELSWGLLSLDRVLVAGASDSDRDRVLLEAISDLAHEHRVDVIAAGVAGPLSRSLGAGHRLGPPARELTVEERSRVVRGAWSPASCTTSSTRSRRPRSSASPRSGCAS